MNKALAVMSKNPAITPKKAGRRSSESGARVTITATAVAVNDPMREMAASQTEEPAAW